MIWIALLILICIALYLIPKGPPRISKWNNGHPGGRGYPFCLNPHKQIGESPWVQKNGKYYSKETGKEVTLVTTSIKEFLEMED